MNEPITLGENPPRDRRLRRRAPPAINADIGAVDNIMGRMSVDVGNEVSGGIIDDGGSTSGLKYCWSVR
jgi:hypothetical protein